MEQTLVYPAISQPTDIDKEKLRECKGLVFNIDKYSIKNKRKVECKELIIDMTPELEASRCPDKYCIYRVPKRLRKINNVAYTPQLVSIGPFHHRREELKDMDIHKFLNLRNFCDRTGKNIEHLKCIIKNEEMEIRSCYSETFLLRSEGFVNMILLDAIFILELFYWKDKEDSENSKAYYQINYILSRPCMERGIQRDLLLLENQLPFFVLEELFKQYGEPKKTLLELSCGFFRDLYCVWKPESKKSCFNDLVGCFCPPQNPSKSSSEPKNDGLNHINDLASRFVLQPGLRFIEVKHFTDLVRNFFRPPRPIEGPKYKCCTGPRCCNHPQNQKHKDKNKRTRHPYGTATQFDEAGLKFTRPVSDADLLQIQFRKNCCLKTFPCFNLSWLLSCLPCLKGTCLVDMQRFLDVPPLCLDDNTEGLFRNLMALEQCHYPYETYVCDYIVLLDDLITTKDDVRLLVEKKIIVNELGSSGAVTKLINNLALEIEESGNLYEHLCQELNVYYENPWNRLVGTLTQEYFSNFFKGTATIVGIIVLGFTLWNFQRLLRWSTSVGMASSKH